MFCLHPDTNEGYLYIKFPVEWFSISEFILEKDTLLNLFMGFPYISCILIYLDVQMETLHVCVVCTLQALLLIKVCQKCYFSRPLGKIPSTFLFFEKPSASLLCSQIIILPVMHHILVKLLRKEIYKYWGKEVDLFKLYFIGIQFNELDKFTFQGSKIWKCSLNLNEKNISCKQNF
jgi:hypothetical protein